MSCDFYWELLDSLTDKISAVPLYPCDLEAWKMCSVPCLCSVCVSVISRAQICQVEQCNCL